ncbi:SNF2-related protein [Paenibacillus cisolokensis]|uniref:SNF2-related protein n=1 Tax=Paenibacillus cisolokensis TaxID=1658519 RepID=UPI003D2E04C2
MDYIDFLKSKIAIARDSGFKINATDIHPALKPHQRDAVQWAVQGGRRALFESFGLGKTVQELEYCRIITERQGGQALIVLPLGVMQEFKRDAVELLGLSEPEYVRTMTEARAATGRILLTNYERVRDGDIDPTYFTACVLDEASVLRSFGSKTYQTFLDKFEGVPYKLVCTATPSPNRYKELIHYAGLSRKTKKAMLGRKWGKHELRKRIAAVVVTPMPYPEPAELSDQFCPKCGCERTRYTGNMSSWPELWTRTYCLRCGFLVATADNSPEVHVLELMCGPDKDEWDPKYWG